MNKAILAVAIGATAAVTLAGCGSSGTPTSVSNDQDTVNAQLDRYQKNQPVPAFDWSQYRQTVIDVESAEVHGVATTTFFFNQGVKEPIFTCPSIGFPVSVTAQLTNPDQPVWGGNGQGYSGVTVGQSEPNGVYTGDSSGTYVTCVAPGGVKFYKYWEGFVDTIGGPAHWDGNQEVLDGAPTVKVNSK